MELQWLRGLEEDEGPGTGVWKLGEACSSWAGAAKAEGQPQTQPGMRAAV